jgi:hypothetical protein
MQAYSVPKSPDENPIPPEKLVPKPEENTLIADEAPTQIDC